MTTNYELMPIIMKTDQLCQRRKELFLNLGALCPIGLIPSQPAIWVVVSSVFQGHVAWCARLAMWVWLNLESSAGPTLDSVDISVALYGLAVIVTVCRLFLRYRTRSWFWDDTLALIAALAMSLFITGEYKITFMSPLTYLPLKVYFCLVLVVNVSRCPQLRFKS